jgi:hypothetical protein
MSQYRAATLIVDKERRLKLMAMVLTGAPQSVRRVRTHLEGLLSLKLCLCLKETELGFY